MIHNVQTLACLFKESVCDTCPPIHFSFKENNWLVIRNAQASGINFHCHMHGLRLPVRSSTATVTVRLVISLQTLLCCSLVHFYAAGCETKLGGWVCDEVWFSA